MFTTAYRVTRYPMHYGDALVSAVVSGEYRVVSIQGGEHRVNIEL